jgi:hypothetical protein
MYNNTSKISSYNVVTTFAGYLPLADTVGHGWMPNAGKW